MKKLTQLYNFVNNKPIFESDHANKIKIFCF